MNPIANNNQEPQQVGQILQQPSFHKEIGLSGNSSDPDTLYADVQLEEQEIKQALYVARRDKYYRMEAAIAEQRKRDYYTWLERPWTTEETYAYYTTARPAMMGYSMDKGADGKPVFVVDVHNQKVLRILSMYFNNDAEFEQMGEGYSLQKGLILAGSVGRGKSDMMKLFCGNKRQGYILKSCREISQQYVHFGNEAINVYSDIHHLVAGDTRFFNQRKLGYCFDDLGTEEIKSNYGNKASVITEILLNRYDRKHTMPYYFTHITTNLDAEGIEQQYGTRIRSRLREMFNLIELTGTDRRK